MLLGANTQGRGLYRNDHRHQNIQSVSEALNSIASGLETEDMRLRDFYRGCWPIINSGKEYVEYWATDCIAEHLEAVHLGQITRLCINIAPKMGKSFHVVIAFPCWEWTKDPRLRSVFSSYSQKLCTRHNLNRRAIITSDWYQNRWGKYVTLAPDQNQKTEFQNVALGHMMTAPVGGSATGSGGDRLFGDDLLNPIQALSQLMRERSNNFYDESLYTRLDDPNTGAIILVEQRTHPDDPTGHIVNEEEGWVKLDIPIEAKRTRTYHFPISGKKHIFEEGELLEPRRFGPKAITRLRLRLHDRGSAQLDQDPSSTKGKLFSRELWKEIEEIPPFTLSVWAWDTAVSVKTTADWTVGTRILLWEKGFVIVDRIRERVTFPGLKDVARNNYEIKPTDALLVEDKSSGQQLIQEFQEGTTLPIIGTEGDWNKLDKITRASLMLPQWAAGRVYVLKGAPWVAEMKEEFAAFGPGCEFDDQVDSVVNGIRYLKNATIGSSEEDSEEEADADIEEGL